MLKKLSIFALIMSICGVATASMPVMKMNKNFDSNAKEAGKIIYSNIDAKPQTKEIAKLRHDDLGLKDDLRLIQKEQSALRTQLNRTDDGVQQQITDLQQQIIDLQRQIINLQRSCCIQNTGRLEDIDMAPQENLSSGMRIRDMDMKEAEQLSSGMRISDSNSAWTNESKIKDIDMVYETR